MRAWQEVLQALDHPRSALELAARIGTTEPLARLNADRVVARGGAALEGEVYRITPAGAAYMQEMDETDNLCDLGPTRVSAEEVVAEALRRAPVSVWDLTCHQLHGRQSPEWLSRNCPEPAPP